MPLLLATLDRKEIRPLPQLPSALGDNPTWVRLTAAISADPADPHNTQRVRVLRELLSLRGPFAQWWTAHMVSAIGSSSERAWLGLGAQCEAAAGVALDIQGVDLDDDGAELVLNTGLLPPAGGELERSLVQAVLDGQCPGTTSIRSLPAQIAVALSPHAFFTASDTGFTGQTDVEVRRRQEAITALRRNHSPFGPIAAERRFRVGEKGSTFPWANTASALFAHTGRCWLASEIAIIGAASSHRSGHTMQPGTNALGDGGHPATLLAQTRVNANNADWWTRQWSTVHDDLGKAEWVLALWAVGARDVITAQFPALERELADLPPLRQRAVLSAANRLGSWGLLAPRPSTATAATEAGVQLLASRTTVATRSPTAPAPQPSRHAARNRPEAPHGTTAKPLSLAEVAKMQRWLQVDRTPTYH